MPVRCNGIDGNSHCLENVIAPKSINQHNPSLSSRFLHNRQVYHLFYLMHYLYFISIC
jgi:hypothetical protein